MDLIKESGVTSTSEIAEVLYLGQCLHLMMTRCSLFADLIWRGDQSPQIEGPETPSLSAPEENLKIGEDIEHLISWVCRHHSKGMKELIFLDHPLNPWIFTPPHQVIEKNTLLTFMETEEVALFLLRMGCDADDDSLIQEHRKNAIQCGISFQEYVIQGFACWNSFDLKSHIFLPLIPNTFVSTHQQGKR